ncbi:MAG: FixH family protein [Pseudohongiellaceae bacterium]
MAAISRNIFLLLASGLALLATQAAYAQFSKDPVLSLETRKGISIEIFSEVAPLDINQIHSWMLHLNEENGAPLVNAVIEVIGGMPEHDHGLPTQPQVTAEIADGKYLLEGVRFHMPGKWQLEIKISYGTIPAVTTETATIDFQL